MSPSRWHPYALVAGALFAAQAGVLLYMGHPTLCTCGSLKLWQGVVASPENSQQLLDWYSFSHIIHGFLFYLLLWLLLPKLSVGKRFVLALGIEVAWEIFENTPMVINHYRTQALAQGYIGDSVVNSLSDAVMACVGFFIASKARVWLVVLIALAFEVFTLYMIRDSLTLNIVQFVHPFPAIWHWQAAR